MELEKEISEREQFLNEMTSIGQGQKYNAIIKGLIQIPFFYLSHVYVAYDEIKHSVYILSFEKKLLLHILLHRKEGR